MTLVKVRSRGINLADTFNFTGTLQQNSGAIAGGKIGQVKTANREGSVTASPSSLSSITSDLELAITPSATSSKILIQCHFVGVYAQDWLYMSIGRSISGGSSTSNLCTGQYGFGGAQTDEHQQVAYSFLDSPNTTSSVSYYPTWRDDNGNENVKINQENNQCSTITLFEVLA